MIDTFTPEPAAAWFSLRLQDARHELASRLRTTFPTRQMYLLDLIAAIAEDLCQPAAVGLATNTLVMHKAAELGVLGFEQGVSVPQLLREYQTLADLLEEFLLDQVRRSDVEVPGDQVVRVMRSLTRSVRVLQQQTVDAFVKQYTETIERQSEQLIAFARLVGHEMRQPLGVLQLMPGIIPVHEGDRELVRLLDVFDRNVRRLADVAGRLQRLSHEALDSVVIAPETVNLGMLVADVVEKLRDLALAHDVRVEIDSELPTLRVDAAQTEMIFVSLIANAIKYSDPSKPVRLVEVLSPRERSVIVRDNGVGMTSRRVQHFFREFSRAHPHRDRDLCHQGLGLGLSIVRSSMDACGGTVLLQSTEGVGTTVTLSWPARARPAAR